MPDQKDKLTRELALEIALLVAKLLNVTGPAHLSESPRKVEDRPKLVVIQGGKGGDDFPEDS